MDEWHFIAERKILEGMEDGAFEQLDGTGKPLDLQENPYEDPSLRMAHRILRNNGFLPDWMEESREIEAEADRLRAEAQSPPPDFAARVAALNRRIDSFNLKAPAANLHKRRFIAGR